MTVHIHLARRNFGRVAPPSCLTRVDPVNMRRYSVTVSLQCLANKGLCKEFFFQSEITMEVGGWISLRCFL